MPGLVSITANPAQLEQARAALSAREFRQAIYQATKRTTAAAVKIVREVVKEDSTISVKYANRAISSKIERGEIPVGTVTISDKRIPLIGFKATKVGSGVSVVMDRSKPAQFFPTAFKAIVKAPSASGDISEHEGWFGRTKHLPTKGPNARGYRVVNGRRYKLTKNAAGVAGALAVKQLMGLKVISLIDQEKVSKLVTERIEGAFEKNLDSQINRFVNGLKAE